MGYDFYDVSPDYGGDLILFNHNHEPYYDDDCPACINRATVNVGSHIDTYVDNCGPTAVYTFDHDDDAAPNDNASTDQFYNDLLAACQHKLDPDATADRFDFFGSLYEHSPAFKHYIDNLAASDDNDSRAPSGDG